MTMTKRNVDRSGRPCRSGPGRPSAQAGRVRGRRLLRTLLAAASPLILTALATPVWAQVAAPPQPPVAPPAAAPPPAVGLQEVVVTARQRTENLQNTPFSITAVGAQKLQDLNVQSTLDLDNKVPGLVLRPDNNRLEPFIGIRGVGDISRSPGIDNRTGIYLDGVPLGRSTSVNYPIYDVDSIEILRGPQGTLFGNNSLTGVLSIQSQKPTQNESSRVTIDAGSRDLFSGSAYLNTALADNLAMRITVAGKSQEGYYKNLYNDNTIGGGTDFAARVQLRWTPTPDTTIDFAADGVSARDDILLGVGQFTTGPSVGLPQDTVNENVQPTRNRKIYGFSLNVDQRLPLDFKFTSISSYRSSRDQLTYDGDGTPASILNVGFKYTDWDVSQEFRIASPKNDLYDYVVGVFYYHQNPGELENVRFGSDYPAAAARNVLVAGGGKVAEDQEAVFAHGTLHPLSWLAIDGGLRYQNTTKSAFKYQASGAQILGYPQYSGHLGLGESSVNPLVSVTVTPVHGVNIYALYSTGDRAGGFNIDVVNSLSDLSFRSESVDNYEVGLKSQFLHNRVRVNVAAYSEHFKDFQQAQNIIDPNPAPGTLPRVISVITNAARVRSEGIETDFDASILSGLTVTGGFGFNHAYYQSFPNGGGPGVDFTNNTLIEAPRFQGSVVVDYKREITGDWDGHAAASYTYRSHVFSQPSDNHAPVFDDRYLENGFADVGLRISALNRKRDYEIALFIDNLTNERHVDGAAPDTAGYLLKELSVPRTIGVEFTLRR